MISIIVPIYKGVKRLKHFLEYLSHQTDKKFELIIVVDTFTENPLKEIDDCLEDYLFIKNNLKLVFNSKRTGRSKAIEAGINEATSEYSIIISNSDILDKTFISSIKNILKIHNSDVIEFNIPMKSPIKVEWKIRKYYPNSSIISENPDIFAYVYPFDFNKLYKTEILKKVLHFSFTTSINSRYSLEFIFKTLLVAQTFSSIDMNLIIFKSDISENYNPLKQISQWKSLFNFLVKNLDNRYLTELTYNFLFTQTQITTKIVNETKSKVLIAKYNGDLISEISNFNTNANQYLLLKSNEALKIQESLKKIF